MSSRRAAYAATGRATALTGLLLATCVLLFTAAPAFAKELHSFSTSFGTAGSGNGQFALTEHSGLAVNQESGDVYVADTGNGRVQEFTSTGTFIRAFGDFTDPTFVAVDDSTGASKGDVYVADSATNTISKFEANGTPITSWGVSGQLDGFAQLAGIAVDSDGDLWIYGENAQMREFSPAGAAITEWSSGLGVTDAGISVDSSGDLYVLQGSTSVEKFSSSGSDLGTVDECGCATGLAVDPADDDLYVDHGTEVLLYTSTGERQEAFGSPEPQAGGLTSGQGIAVGPAHTVYVADSASQRIDIYTEAPAIPLTVTETGPGVVKSSPAGIECGSSCTSEFAEGSTVTLTATSTERSAFSGWTVAGHPNVCSGTGPCEVEMSAAQSVTAVFTAIPQEKLTITTEGPGTVSDMSPGPEFTAIDCGNGATTCEAEYNQGTMVTLTATAGIDYHFSGWTTAGNCELESGAECTVTMSAAKSVKAEFSPTMRRLTVVSSGSGSVTSSPPGIVCEEGSCEAEYQEGDTITLTAHPGSHHRLAAWGSGEECAFEPSPTVCEVEIPATNAKVEADFAPIQHALVVTSDGGGAVSATSGAISDCAHAGGACSGEYDEATTVTLVASPFAHSVFKGWGAGQCEAEPQVGKCEVEVGSATTAVTAEFAPIMHLLTVAPTGPGTVTASSGPITDCESGGGTCAGEYIEAATVHLMAFPAPHQIVVWTGCSRASGDTCEIEVGTTDTGIQASFVPATQTLTVALAGTGSGSVTCNGSPCAGTYPEGTILTLTATPTVGSTFGGWSGAGCSGSGACQFTLEANAQVTANFSASASSPAEEKCVVPVLAGKTLAQASSALNAAHCSRGKVTKPKSKRRNQMGPLVVRSSSPVVGSALPAATKVDLTLGPKRKRKH